MKQPTPPVTSPFQLQRIIGLHGAARGLFIAEQFDTHPRMLVVAPDSDAAEGLLTDIELFAPAGSVFSLPAWDCLPFEAVSPQRWISAQRLKALDTIHRQPKWIIVTTADAMLQRSVPLSFLEATRFELRVGTQMPRHVLATKLTLAGFQHVSLVEEIGEFSVRGGIVDAFPATSKQPVRIELLNDRIVSIRLFDPADQRSTGSCDCIDILPVREVAYIAHLDRYSSSVNETVERLTIRGKSQEVPPRDMARIINAVRTSAELPGLELLQTLIIGPFPSLFDQLPADTALIVCNEIAIQNRCDSFHDIIEERYARMRQDAHLVPEPDEVYLSIAAARHSLRERSPLIIDTVAVLDAHSANIGTKVVQVHPLTALVTKLSTKVGTGNALLPLKQALNRWRSQSFRIAFIVGSAHRGARLQRLLLGIGYDAEQRPGLTPSQWLHAPLASPVAILEGQLSEGFEFPQRQVVFVAEHQVFRERSYKRRVASSTNIRRLMNSLAQLAPGNYVVHTDYGIGVYQGLQHRTVDGHSADFLQIDYLDSKLFLPVQHIGKIQKFVAPEGMAPQLDKLSSSRWLKTKEKVRQSVAALAGDLIRLYAARSIAKGWRFDPMGAEDERFADGFPYEETADQWKAITETLADMAGEKPMDRLICGDVGFGKTEVALRAAYKCVEHGRQAAVLVPTTILVEQHRGSFENRFLGYPVRIGAVSRFYDKTTNAQTLSALAAGEIDIIIGTHRLLQKDVTFKDLGLVVIDEEHRFGVKQKERLKSLKRQVDVLTLTATPIPRTLHMALLGIRDISVISTPPIDRHVIRTYIAEHNGNLVRDAVLRELQRGGQVFYVFNRIEGIEVITAQLRELVPEARFEFAHGQMREDTLAKIMHRFMQREFDVLVTTTIIESGLDIPNANTIIVDRADRFGLAQLYQLRGRVGRSDRQAYAYLLIPHVRGLGAEAQRRLQALQALDDLGLGFNLALADLEIRGAGNLLGKEQSGNVSAVGFDLYTRILKEAVMHLKGEELALEEIIDPEIKLGVDAFIPELYIPDISERLVLYQRLAALHNSAEADELLAEIEDRFGPPPREVRSYLELMRLRSLLRSAGIDRLEINRGRVLLSFSRRAPIAPERVLELVRKQRDRYRFSSNYSLSIALPEEAAQEPETLYNLLESLLPKILAEESSKPPAVPALNG
ncbi:MAG: transcription-repair coupling factor [Bdellovibrionota bacterium]|nr:MAG: transcription-repair coupling factor [Bdellovibrionota bacterium]